MKNNLYRKGFIVPVLLGIIALLIIGGGLYSYNTYKNKWRESPPRQFNESENVGLDNQQAVAPIDTTVKNTNINIYKETDLRKFIREKYSFYAPKEWVESSVILSGNKKGCELYSINYGGDGHRLGGEIGIYLNSCFNKLNPPSGPVKESIEKDGYYIVSMYDKDSGTSPTEELKTKEVYKKVVETFTLNQETMIVKVYFRKDKRDTNVCVEKDIKVESLNRTIPKTLTVAKASIEELLKGPTQDEKNNGYWSDIPDGVILKSITITNGEALIDFNKEIESGVTTCSGGTRISQIRQTLLQFPTIKTVKFSVNGNTEYIFQP